MTGKSPLPEAETPADIVIVPDAAGEHLRTALGLEVGAELRISYICGPGDVRGTFDHWRLGRFDPRVPSVAYSTMFYTLCDKLGAQAQLVMRSDEAAAPERLGAFRFDRVRGRREAGRIGYRVAEAAYAKASAKVLADFQPHLAVIASDFPQHGLPPIRSMGPRLILSIHNSFWSMGATNRSLRERVKHSLTARLLRAVDAALCTSAECARQFSHLAGAQTPTFVEIPQQRSSWKFAVEQASKPRSEGRLLLFLGRVENDKGVFDLIDAFKRLRARHRDIVLRIAGDGGAAEAVAEQLEVENFGEAARYLGRLDADQVHEILARTHLLVCPTRSAFKEGLALVCVEAAVHGAPSVMSSVVPARDLLPDSGEVFQADDAESLTAALDRLLSDPSLHAERSRLAQDESAALFDRSRSWGSQLYKTMLAASGR